ncbi:hypothetical protein L1049_014087 [Liquidambar formosana]|uniref:Mitochondrial carrier protein n=1 Tax=Liquidambar formosana TaxID=63359 RepID=A0AAP0RMC5_LIQFO
MGTRQNVPSWLSAAVSRVDFEGNVSPMSEKMFKEGKDDSRPISDINLGFGERTLSAAGAAFLSAILVNPLDVAKTRLQAQAAGVPYQGLCRMASFETNTLQCSSNLFTYGIQVQNYRILWTGLGAQLARDVPFSAICWSTLEPIRRRILGVLSDKTSAASVLGANFSAGFIAGSLAAAATCPLDVAKTRRQIEKDPARALNMTTRQTLQEIWRDGGMRGLFTGISPRVARAGPSVGIVVSFYEVVKYALHHRHQANDLRKG